jgi:riboflavin synthase alpha subunit
LRRLRGGEPVNLEIDTVARYVERMLAVGPG